MHLDAAEGRPERGWRGGLAERLPYRRGEVCMMPTCRAAKPIARNQAASRPMPRSSSRTARATPSPTSGSATGCWSRAPTVRSASRTFNLTPTRTMSRPHLMSSWTWHPVGPCRCHRATSFRSRPVRMGPGPIMWRRVLTKSSPATSSGRARLYGVMGLDRVVAARNQGRRGCRQPADHERHHRRGRRRSLGPQRPVPERDRLCRYPDQGLSGILAPVATSPIACSVRSGWRR